MAVPVKTGPEFQPGTPAPLFRTDALGFFDFSRNDYAATANGERFLVNSRIGGAGPGLLTVTTGWRPR
jgi:hypothetical protein